MKKPDEKNKDLKKAGEPQQPILSKAEIELRDLKLDLNIVDTAFDKWYREEEALSTVLNMKVIRQRNIDFR